MTKKEWSNLRVGSKVKTETSDIDRSSERPTFIKKVIFGTVVRSNANHSQVLVKWDNDNGHESERWYGRLGIELTK